ncbi:MAG: glucokinase [Pseudomonadota bacterium]
MSFASPSPPRSVTPATAASPWLVADIGGTNARFGLVRQAGGPVSDVRSAKGRDHPSPQAAALAYLDAVLGPGQRVARAALAIAAPVNADPVMLTNSPWQVSRQALCKALQTDEVLLLNDFEALAWSLPGLRAPTDWRPIGASSCEDSDGQGNNAVVTAHTLAVVGPGTGLGAAGCVPHAGGWLALPAEGGHVTVCAADAFEDALLSALRPEHPHLSAERLLSGSGLPTLHRGVCLVHGWSHTPLPPEQITARGLARQDPASVLTLDTFCAMLGTFAGNVALTLGARGGVFVAGGIAAVLADWLVASQFRERFEAKGRFRSYLQAIPTALVTAPHAALTGAATALEQAR